MRKNVAGQVIAAEMVSSEDGSAFTGTVTVYITGDGGTQAIGTVDSGVCTHEGNGLHTYQPSQAETNYTHIAFTFVGLGAVPVTIQVYTNVDTQLLDIQSRIPASLNTGRMVVYVESMAANVVTAAALATDAVQEIQSGLALESTLTVIAGYIDTEIAAIKAKTDNLPSDPADQSLIEAAITLAVADLATTTQLTTVEGKVDVVDANVDTLLSRITATLFSGITYLSRWLGAIAGKSADTGTRAEINATTGGANYNETTDSLEAIRDRGDTAWITGGGGGTSIMVTPVVAQTPVRVIGSNIETFIGDLSDIRVGVFSGTDPVDLSTMGDLEVCVQLKSGVDLDLVAMADITIDGDDNNYFSWAPNSESVDAVRTGKWSLRKASNKQVIAYGAWIVVDAALSDAS